MLNNLLEMYLLTIRQEVLLEHHPPERRKAIASAAKTFPLRSPQYFNPAGSLSGLIKPIALKII
jgi:hypothetical protein